MNENKNAINYNIDFEELKRKEKKAAIKRWGIGLVCVIICVVYILLKEWGS